MTKQELEELLQDCPTLYHMAEHGSWSSIRERGLLSTTAILNLYGVDGEERQQIEERRRPKGVTLEHKSFPPIVIRDQIPIRDGALKTCLLDGLKPLDWYRLLNGRVFFWLSNERLLRLLGARAYREKMHDILEVDAAAIVKDFSKSITLSPINSGSTLFNPSPRGKKTFSRISDYPYSYWRSRRRRGDRVAELAIDYSLPNIANYVGRVLEMRGNKIIRVVKKHTDGSQNLL